MPSKKIQPVSHNTPADTSEAVDRFMRSLDHPLKQGIEAMRAAILAANPAIAEGIKWNAPSFRTSEYFATTNLREKNGFGVIFHLGAKVRDQPAGGMVIEDPLNLLKWLAKDRAAIAFESLADFNAKKYAFERIIQQWISFV